MGVYGLFETFVIVSIGIINLGLRSAIIGFGARDKQSYNRYISSGIIGIIVLGLTGVFIYIIAARYISYAVTGSVEYYNVFIMAVIYMYFHLLGTAFESIWLIKNRGKLLTISRILSTAVELASAFFFVAIVKYGVLGIFISKTFSYALITILGFISENRVFRISLFDIKSLKEMLVFGLPTVPHKIALNISNGIGRYIIQLTLGLEFVGIFTLSEKISKTLTFITNPLTKALTPFIISNNVDSEDSVSRSTLAGRVYLAAVFFIVTAVFHLLPFIVKVIDKNDVLSGHHNVIKVLIVGLIFQSFYELNSIGILKSHKTYFLPIITLITMLVNFIGSWFLTSKLLIFGTAIGVLLSMIVKSIISSIGVEKSLGNAFIKEKVILSVYGLILFTSVIVR